MSLRRIAYSLLLYLIFPIVLFRLYWRGRVNPAYRQRIAERLGFVQADSEQAIIWVHAVSVGETIAAKPFIEGLIHDYPNHRILVTTTTPTGSDRVKALFGERVAHVYFPYDLPEIIARFLKRINPQALIIVETEIWPNLYAACASRDIPLFIINARLSKKSTQGYQKISGLIAETLSGVNLIAVRSDEDKGNFLSLGANEQQLEVVGNIKFDFEIDEGLVKQGLTWKQQWGSNRKVWVAASTHEGEDEILLGIFKQLLSHFPELLLVLVPRHPERFDSVFKLCRSFEVERHSQKSAEEYQNFKGNIIIGDSMGEMPSWFAVADVVFIGGSLVETGGHNPLEAIAQGKPVVSGQYMFNFSDVAPYLQEQQLLFSFESSNELTQKLIQLFDQPDDYFLEKTTKIMQQNQGVTARLLVLFSELRKGAN
jgi:3-deoxy-D-manno-octulosonic-acid transferase